MTQTIILKKLALYLEQIDPVANKKLISLLRESGHCMALAICYGAMEKIKKLDWWQQSLVDIANWDEKPETLKLPTQYNPRITREKIFERFVNYIFINQACSIEQVVPGLFLRQEDFLSPYTSGPNLIDTPFLFEFTNEDKSKPSRIMAQEKIVGHFTNEDVVHLFIPGYLSGKSCVVTNHNHAILIYPHNNKFVVYDPNYSHQSIHAMTKTFNTAEACFVEITRILRAELIFNILHFEEPIKKSPLSMFYDVNIMTLQQCFSLLEGEGLAIIASENLTLFKAMLNKFDNKLRKTLYSQLIRIMSDPGDRWNRLIINDAWLMTTLISAALDVLSEGNTHWSKDNYKFIVEIRGNNESILSLALAHGNVALLDRMLKSFSSHQIIDLLLRNITNKPTLLTGLHFMLWLVSSKPHLLLYLNKTLNLARKNDNYGACLKKIFAEKIDNNMGCLAILCYCPELLPSLCAEMVEHHGIDELIALFSRKITANVSMWNMMHSRSSHFLQIVNGLCYVEKIKMMTEFIFKNTQQPAIAIQEAEKVFADINVDKTDLTLSVIKRYILAAPYIQKILDMFVFIEKAPAHQHLFQRTGYTSWSLRGHCWKGKPVSGAWVAVIELAKQRIVELIKKFPYQYCNEDVVFLKMKTQEITFFPGRDYAAEYEKYSASNLRKNVHFLV